MVAHKEQGKGRDCDVRFLRKEGSQVQDIPHFQGLHPERSRNQGRGGSSGKGRPEHHVLQGLCMPRMRKAQEHRQEKEIALYVQSVIQTHITRLEFLQLGITAISGIWLKIAGAP